MSSGLILPEVRSLLMAIIWVATEPLASTLPRPWMVLLSSLSCSYG